MKREITIDKFGHKSSGKWGYVGEGNITHLSIELPEELIPCDFCRAEITNAGNKIPTDRLEINDGKVEVVIPFSGSICAGKITVQIIGYVVDEVGEIYAIGKTAEFTGQISVSAKGKNIEVAVFPTLLDRIWAKLEAWAGKIHEHANKEQLDLITTEMLQSIGTDKPVVIKTGIRYAGAISSNVCTVFETKMDRLAITALLDASAKNTIPEYVFIFTSGAGGFPTTLSMPRGIKWANDDIPEIKVDFKYIIRIFDNVASYTEVTI